MAGVPKIIVMGPEATLLERPMAELRAAGFEPAAAPLSALQSPDVANADLIVLAGSPPDDLDGLPVALWGAGRPGIGWLPEGAPPAPLRACVDALLQAAVARREANQARRHDQAMRELFNLLTVLREWPELLHEVATVVAQALGADRASVFLVGEDPEVLFVVGASDDRSLGRLATQLSKYPEVRAAMESRATIYVEDAPNAALLGEVRESVVARGVGAILVAPILYESRAVGVIIARWQEPNPALGERSVSFGALAASALSATLRGTDILLAVQGSTYKIAVAERFESERQAERQQALEHYRDFFESTSDGTVVLDAQGHILYINRAGEMLTGYRQDGLLGRPFAELCAEGHREGMAGIARQAASGGAPLAFDLHLVTVSGDPVIVSVSTSSVLANHGAAILVFRDVTEARALENELRKTKEFLERLIDSAVDGIIVADIHGKIILFNKGAERIYGYRSEDVVGRLAVERLYPDGGARRVMEELRSPDLGGRGRLELSRRDILTSEGELVPVNMTAAILYEDGREIASVGIFTDLRGWLKLEQRLMHAQERLVATEKQAMLAELAGTTAHELNQPLTSIMGYAELIKKKMTQEDMHHRAIETILREAERMAEIVRKIGKITRYETKTYVGSTQILDLEKSTE